VRGEGGLMSDWKKETADLESLVELTNNKEKRSSLVKVRESSLSSLEVMRGRADSSQHTEALAKMVRREKYLPWTDCWAFLWMQIGCVEALLEQVLKGGDVEELALKGLVQLSLSKETRVDMYNVMDPIP